MADEHPASIYVERIEIAQDTLQIYMGKALPDIPNAITTSEQRHLMTVEQRSLEEWGLEVLTQIDEIRNARNAYTAMLGNLQGNERKALEADYKASITPNDLNNFVKAASRHLEALRALKKKVEGLLGQRGGPGRKNVALPILSLTPFDGVNWEDFWPLFNSTIHSDTELSQVQKMGYLDSLLRGEPKKILQGLTPYSDANYTTAVKLLEDKYGRTEYIIRDFHNQLAKLPSSKSFDDDVKLQLDVERLCRQLEQHGQDLSSPQIFLGLEQKLSKKTLQKYVEAKMMKQATMADPAWTTTLFRETFKLALDFLQQIKDTYHRGGTGSERTNERRKSPTVKKEQDESLNLAIRYQNNPVQGQQSRSNYRYQSPRGSNNGDRRSPNRSNQSQRPNSRSPDRSNRSRTEYRGRTHSSKSTSGSSDSSRSSKSRQSKSPVGRKNSPWPEQKQYMSDKERGTSSSRSRSPSKFPCPFCESKHYPIDCEKYKTIDERRKQIEAKKLCFVCLRPNHMAKDCRRKSRKCFVCRRPNHHPALCESRFKPRTEQATSTVSDWESDSKEMDENSYNLALQSCLKNPKSIHSLLKCARVTIYNPRQPKKRQRVLAFLDDGSEKTYINKSLIKDLELEVVDEVNFNLRGMGGHPLGNYQSTVVELGLKGKAVDMLVRARKVEKVMPKLPYIKFDKNDLQKLMANKIPIPPKFEEPQILIGGDFYNHLAVKPSIQLSSGFWISDSKLGKIINGEGKLKEFHPQGNLSRSTTITSASINEQTVEFGHYETGTEELQDAELTRMVNRHQQLETIGLGDADPVDAEEMKKFKDGLKFNGERYEVKLCWNEEIERLPDNYYLALGRLKSIRKKLMERPELLKQYNDIIQDQLSKGIIEKVPKSEQFHARSPANSPLERGIDKNEFNPNGCSANLQPKKPKQTTYGAKPDRVLHFLPHHFVERADKQFTKVRIVFDASAKLRKHYPSLNECLSKGPKLYNDLTGILLRARLKPYILTCDVEKAFLQIAIHEDDRDAFRFLWFERPEDPNSPIVEYRWCRVIFGAICSPAHLAVVLKDLYGMHDNELVRHMESDTYIDNLLNGLENPGEIYKCYEFLKEMFKGVSMNVREFTSNAFEQIKQIPECDRTDSEETKLLGLHWNVVRDTLAVKLPDFPDDKPVTRRTVVSQVAKPFEPMGHLSPIILQAKLLRQKIEKERTYKWDDLVSDESQKTWRKLMTSWKGQVIEFPRRFGDYSRKNVKRYELHGFADASEAGLGAAIYLRIMEKDGTLHSKLAFAKSLVVPPNLLKSKLSIPKLELHAARICCTNLLFVKRELEKEIKLKKVQIWTDSTDVVDFLNSSKEKDRFVKNRIKAIRKLNLRVTHIPGKNNPADLASRGVQPSELKDNLFWFNGPDFLEQNEEYWNKPIREFDPETFVPEEQPPLFEMSMATKAEDFIPLANYENFSQYKRLRNTMAYMLRAVDLFKNPQPRTRINKNVEFKRLFNYIPTLSVEEINNAEVLLVQEAQEMFPPDDSTVQNLDLFMDQGILRAKGRLQNSDLEFNAIHPIFLDKRCPIVDLIIMDTHRERKHAGIENMVAALRQNYWIPRCRNKINSVLKKNDSTRCHICARFLAKAYNYPEAPPLPDFRVNGEQIWETVGIDYFGPILVKGKSEKDKTKVWGAIFTCALTRMIHLELVTDISAEKFLLAFTRFIRRWRTPAKIISDNGTNFIAANKVLKKLTKESQEEKQRWLDIYEDSSVQNFSTNNKIEWIFISPYAPWKGGMYERMIGTVKYHLKRETRQKLFNFEELWTILTEIERIVNERPLTYISEREVVQPLRPIDLAIPGIKGATLDITPSPFDLEDPDYIQDRSSRETMIEKYRRTLISVEKFWRQWKEAYLLSLREKHQSCVNNKSTPSVPQVGDIVLIEDVNAPRSQWRLGRLEKLVSSRTAKIRVNGKILERAVKHLYPLELQFEYQSNQNQSNQNQIKINLNGEIPDEQLVHICTIFQSKMDDDFIPDYEEEIGPMPINESKETGKTTEESNNPAQTIVVSSAPPPKNNTNYGKIVIASPLAFIGDHSLNDLATEWQNNELKGLAILSNDPDWWQNLHDRVDLKKGLCQMIIFGTEAIQKKFASWLFSQRGSGIHQISLIWASNNQCPEGFTTLNINNSLAQQLMQLVELGAPRQIQQKGSAKLKRLGSERSLGPNRKRPPVQELSQQRQAELRAVQLNAERPTSQEESTRAVQLDDSWRQSSSRAPVQVTNQPSSRAPVEVTWRQPEQQRLYCRMFDFKAMEQFPNVPTTFPDRIPFGRIINCGNYGRLIGFFTHRYYFSNLNDQYGFELNTQRYHSTEMFYTAHKALATNNWTTAQTIFKGELSPMNMKAAASFKNMLADDDDIAEWTRTKAGVMLEALQGKFYQNPILRDLLLSTGHALLAELAPDPYWGVGCDPGLITQPYPIANIDNWRGRNTMGMLLMIVRQNLRGKNDEKTGKESLPVKGPELAVEPRDMTVEHSNMAVKPNDIRIDRMIERIKLKNARPAVIPFGDREERKAVQPPPRNFDLNSLSESIWDTSLDNLETDFDVDRKLEISETLNLKLNEKWGRSLTMLFGSTLARLGKKGSDLDLFVYKIAKDECTPEEDLKQVQKVISDHFHTKRIILITKGVAPCLKTEIMGQNIDVTIGSNLKGVFNGTWENTLGRINDLFRSFVIILKLWGSSINEPALGTFNSMSFVIMAQVFLEEKGQLPNLFRLEPETYRASTVFDFLNPTLHKSIAEKIKKDFHPEKVRIVDLLIEFFNWLQDFNPRTEKLSARNGKLPYQPDGKHILRIEEPFDSNSNTARTLNQKGYDKFLRLLRRTVESTEKKDWNEFAKLLGVNFKLIPVQVLEEENEEEYIKKHLNCNLGELFKEFSGNDTASSRSSIAERLSRVERSSILERTELIPPIRQRIERQEEDNGRCNDFGAGPDTRRPITENHRKQIDIVNPDDDDDEYDPIDNFAMNRRKSKSPVRENRRSNFKRVFTNPKFSFLIVTMLLSIASAQVPLVCHRNRESKFARITRNPEACSGLSKIFDDKPKQLSLTLYRPDEHEYQFWGTQCAVVKQWITYWTNIFNDPFEKPGQEKIVVSKDECLKMRRTHECKHGPLFGDPSAIMSTSNVLNIDNGYWHIGKRTETKTNCIMKNITLVGKPGKETVESAVGNLAHCHYRDGYCKLGESIVVWEVEDNEGSNVDWNDKRRCTFKELATYNGTLYRSGWISETSDLALTFPQYPDERFSCSRDLVISHQGFAISEKDYRRLKELSSSRSRRSPVKDQPLDGEVHTSQLESQLEARAMFADKQLIKMSKAFSKLICEYIDDSVLTDDLSHINPSLLIRKLANTNNLEAKWTSSNILEFWHCSMPITFDFIPSNGQCYTKLPMNVTISRDNQPVLAYLDPITHILHSEASVGPCEIYQFQSVQIKNSVIKVNQLTGENSVVQPDLIKEITLHNKAWKLDKPPTDLQIFRLLVITNLSDTQLDMMKSFNSLRSNIGDLNPATKSEFHSSGGGSTEVESSLVNLLWSRVDDWKYTTRITIILVIVQWLVKLYLFVTEFRLKRIAKREIEKENPKGKSELKSNKRVNFEDDFEEDETEKILRKLGRDSVRKEFNYFQARGIGSETSNNRGNRGRAPAT